VEKMTEFCGVAAEYLDCRGLPYDAGEQGGFFELFTSSTSELEQKHIYRPSA
jgi:hypothetical protein